MRWNIKLNKETETPEIELFIEEIKKVYVKHGLSLAHEDCHGGFIVEKISDNNLEWLDAAMNNTDE